MSNNKNKSFSYSGKLNYNDRGEYELDSLNPKYCSINLSELLKSICYSYNNYIEIKILKGCKILFEESGKLVKNFDKHNIFSFHVNSEDFESVLFNNTNEFIDIEIVSGYLDDIDRQNIENSESRQGDYTIDVRTK